MWHTLAKNYINVKQLMNIYLIFLFVSLVEFLTIIIGLTVKKKVKFHIGLLSNVKNL